MADKTYNFVFSSGVQAAPVMASSPNAPGMEAPSIVADTGVETSSDFMAGAGKKMATSVVSQAVISPLNQMTGGAATPVYGIVKAAVSGGGSAALGGAAVGLAVWTVQKGIQLLEERIKKMEAKAIEMNERDNVLLRSGAKSEATFYEGGLMGVKERNTNRS